MIAALASNIAEDDALSAAVLKGWAKTQTPIVSVSVPRQSSRFGRGSMKALNGFAAERKSVKRAVSREASGVPRQQSRQNTNSFSPFRQINALAEQMSALAAALGFGDGTSEEEVTAFLSKPQFSFVVLACATVHQSIHALRSAAGMPALEEGHLLTKSIHVIGVEDPAKPNSEEIATLFADRDVFYMPGGHAITRIDDVELCESIRWLIAAEQQPAPANHEWNRVSDITTLSMRKDRQVAVVRLDEAKIPSRTVMTALAAQPSDAPLLRIARGGKTATTYGDMLDFIAGAGDLRRLGVQPGDVVAYGAPPGGSAASGVAFLSIGAQTCGAPLSQGTTEPDAESALEQFNAKHLILFEGVHNPGITAAFTAYAATGRATLHMAVITGDDAPGMYTYTTVVAEAELARRLAAPALLNPEDGVCLMLRTSGTTSKPKGVPLMQGQIVVNGAILAATIGLKSDDVCYGIMPLFHIGGISASILCSLAVGASITCDGPYNPEMMAKALMDSVPKPTWYSSVPTIHNATVAYLKDNAEEYGVVDGVWKGSGLRMIRSGAAALTGPDGAALQKMYGGVPLFPTCKDLDPRSTRANARWLVGPLQPAVGTCACGCTWFTGSTSLPLK